MNKLFKVLSLGLLITSIASCSPSSCINGNMYKNTKGVFHVLNTNTDLVPEYYYITRSGNYELYMKDDYTSEIVLSQGTFTFFKDGNCLICNHK